MKKFVGTPYYVSPGVLAGKYSIKCDVWSLGVIMYIMLYGNAPFNGHTNKQIYEKIQQAKPSFSGKVWDRVSIDCINVVKAMLTKDYEKRPSIEQVLQMPWFNSLKKNKSH